MSEYKVKNIGNGYFFYKEEGKAIAKLDTLKTSKIDINVGCFRIPRAFRVNPLILDTYYS